MVRILATAKIHRKYTTGKIYNGQIVGMATGNIHGQIIVNGYGEHRGKQTMVRLLGTDTVNTEGNVKYPDCWERLRWTPREIDNGWIVGNGYSGHPGKYKILRLLGTATVNAEVSI